MFVAEQNMKSILAEALRRNLEAHAEEEGIDFILNWGLSGEGVLVRQRALGHHDGRARAHQQRPMTVAARKKQEHIVDHVLYCWQMEDLVRASQFQPAVLESWAEQHALAEGTDPQAEIDWI